MSEPLAVPFISKNGIRGTVRTFSRLLDDEPEKSVIFETGRQAVVGSEHLHLRPDGTFYLDLNVDPRPPDRTSPAPSSSKPNPTNPNLADVVIPLVEEQLVIGKRLRETGRVRVSKNVVEELHVYDASIAYEEYEVEHVPVDREVTEITPTRVEGDVTIISVYEEEIVTMKRLVLREEIRLTKRLREEHHPATMNLRKQQVVIERLGPKND